MAIPETGIISARKSNDARRLIGSNIGVRRQHRPSQNTSASLDPQESGYDDLEDSPKSTLQSDRHSSQRGRYLSHQSNRSRTRDLRREQTSTIGTKLTTSGRRAAENSFGLDSAQSTESQEETSGGSVANGSSDHNSDSPLTILINPDLDVLPVVKTHQARVSFDFYVNSYVTSIIEVSPQDVEKYTHVVHQILHDEMLFTAFTTCSEAARWRTQNLYDDPPINVVKGYGKTISLLSQRLQSQKFAMSPAVLLAMGQLVAIETLTKNVSATARHLAGMQSMMMAKTGAKPAQGSSPVQTAVDIWTKYFMYRGALKASINRSATLTYPRHPFDPDVSNQISELPIGFADVALSGRVSLEILGLMHRFNTYFNKINQMIKEGVTESEQRTHIVLQQAAYCIEYVQMQALTLIERLILVALTAYVVRRDRLHPALVNMRNYYQITCAYILNLLGETTLHQKDQGSDLSTWVGLILLLTSTPEAYARKLALKLLPGRPEPLKILKQCQNFFWDEDLTNALLTGSVLSTTMSNDIIAENVKQALPESEE